MKKNTKRTLVAVTAILTPTVSSILGDIFPKISGGILGSAIVILICICYIFVGTQVDITNDDAA